MNAQPSRARTEEAANLQAWTEQAAEARQSVNLSTQSGGRVIRGTTVQISIPLDPTVPPRDRERDDGTRPKGPATGQVHVTYEKNRRTRRDSLERREALLKGKERSRQRRRWENGESY